MVQVLCESGSVSPQKADNNVTPLAGIYEKTPHKNGYSNKHLSANVCNSFIHKMQRAENTQVSIDR